MYLPVNWIQEYRIQLILAFFCESAEGIKPTQS